MRDAMNITQNVEIRSSPLTRTLSRDNLREVPERKSLFKIIPPSLQNIFVAREIIFRELIRSEVIFPFNTEKPPAVVILTLDRTGTKMFRTYFRLSVFIA